MVSEHQTRTGEARTSLGVRLAVIAGTALAMLVTDFVVGYVVALGLFGSPWTLVGVPIAALVLVVVIAVICNSLTGRYHVVGALAVTAILTSVGAYGFVNGILTPLATDPSWPLHFLVCALAAATLGLFLGPWPLRLVGAGGAIALIALMAFFPTSAERAAVDYAESQESERADLLDYFRDHGTHPVVTELAGWTNARLRATGNAAVTWTLGPDGGVATVLVSGEVNPATMDVNAPCTRMQREGDMEVPAPGGLPSWCLKTETGWTRSDGTASAYVEDGTMVVITPSNEFEILDAGGTRAAVADEIAALVASLRPMTDAEVEQWVVPTYAGADSPVVDTPGL